MARPEEKPDRQCANARERVKCRPRIHSLRAGKQMSDSHKTPTVLIILDGWGYREETRDNAIANGNTPVWDRLWSEAPHTLISGSGVGPKVAPLLKNPRTDPLLRALATYFAFKGFASKI